jgi:ribosomal protein S18 acetylase RimI-like enzyme
MLRQPQYYRIALPLFRRLQFGRYLDGSYLLTNLALTTHPESERTASSTETNGSKVTASQQGPWLAAFVDRSCRPETEVWLFGSWEASPPPSANTTSSNDAIPVLLHSLIQAIKALGLPPSIHSATSTSPEDEEKDSVGLSRKDYGSHISNPNITLWGAVHASTIPYLQTLGIAAGEFHSTWVANRMFVFAVHELPQRALPETVRWGKLSSEHFALVRSRTQIPRQEATLAVLSNIGLFPTEGSEEVQRSPVAWAFVGLDSSLTTLHVEPEYRRQGLAQILTSKLLREEMDMFWEEGIEKLGFGYVIIGNDASAGMCRSLGGKADWEVYWIRVDLSKA